MNRRAIALTIVATAILSACGSDSASKAPETSGPPETTDIRLQTKLSCALAVEQPVRLALDYNDAQPIVDAWGVQGAMFQTAVDLYQMGLREAIAHGVNEGYGLLMSQAMILCSDGDVANEVLHLTEGDASYSTACLDGRAPTKKDDKSFNECTG